MKRIKNLSKNIRVTSRIVTELSGDSYQIGAIERRRFGIWWTFIRREFTTHPAVNVLNAMERNAVRRGLLIETLSQIPLKLSLQVK